MHQQPVPPDPGDNDSPRPVPPWPDWMDDPAYLAGRPGDEDPGGGLDLDEDPEDAPPPDVDPEELAAEAERITADQARAAEVVARLGLTAAMAADAAAAAGRRGPGMPGSAESVPGVYASRASGFASGKPLDVAPGCLTLGQFAEVAAGEDDRYPGASDDELAGAICAWDRVEAYAGSRKHAAVAELIRRRPAPGAAVAGAARMPGACDEFAVQELASVLGESRTAAGDIVSLAQELEINLPGTRAAFRSGIVSRRKAMIIAEATVLLDPAQAGAAEAMVLGRAGTLTPPGLRAAIARAVMEVAPGKAKKRREHAAEKTRVERWAEASGNAGLAGRELPPAQVLAADQRVTAWANELRKAGLEGGIDALRAQAYLDILLGMDSRPLGSRADGSRQPQDPNRPEDVRHRPQDPAPAPGSGCRLRWPGAGRAAGRDDPARVRRAGHLDHPRGHPDRTRGPARRAGRHRARRPGPGPRSGCCRGPQPQVDLVRDGDRQPGPRHRPRLRPSRKTAKTRRTRSVGRPQVHLHPHRSARPARRVRHLAIHHRPAGPAHRDRSDADGGVRSPVGGPGPRSRGDAPAPDGGPATRPVRGRAVGGPPGGAISSTTFRTRQAVGHVCATGAPNAATTIA